MFASIRFGPDVKLSPQFCVHCKKPHVRQYQNYSCKLLKKTLTYCFPWRCSCSFAPWAVSGWWQTPPESPTVPPADRLSYHSYCKREWKSLSRNLEREQEHKHEHGDEARSSEDRKKDRGWVYTDHIHLQMSRERHLKMPPECGRVMSNKYSPYSRKYLTDSLCVQSQHGECVARYAEAHLGKDNRVNLGADELQLQTQAPPQPKPLSANMILSFQYYLSWERRSLTRSWCVQVLGTWDDPGYLGTCCFPWGGPRRH